MIALACRGVVRELANGAVTTPILRGIDITIPRGEFVALTGASGSGKSTLLYVLGVLDRPTRGAVYVGERETSALDDDARAELRLVDLGFVFQFHFLLPELTVLENVEVPMRRRGTLSSKEIRARATDALVSLGLQDLLARKPHQLSGGQQQRVSIARAIAHAPQILLADEPTGNLDSVAAESVMRIFESLARDRGMTIVMVTHERSFAARAHREIRLRDGLVESDVRMNEARDPYRQQTP